MQILLGALVGFVVCFVALVLVGLAMGRRQDGEAVPAVPAVSDRQVRQANVLWVDGEVTVRYEICAADGWPLYYWN